MRNMEDLETMFISARHAKMNTNNHIREQKEFYRKEAIDFLNKYNFNKVISKACEERCFSIPPIQIKERELAYAVGDVLDTLGYMVRVKIINGIYSIDVHWNNGE